MAGKPESFTCKRCGQVTPFGDEVLKKWDSWFVVTCRCGAKYNLRRGVIKPYVPEGPDP